MAWAVVIAAACAGLAHAAEVIHADGHHEDVEALTKDAQGRWSAVVDGRRTTLRPGEIAAVVDDEGRETATIPELADAPDAAPVQAALARLADPKNEMWFPDAELLGARPTKSLHDALVALTVHADPKLRRRGVVALARLRTKESVAAAAKAVVAEKDTAARRDGATALFAAREILGRADAAETIRAGLADKDAAVRLGFAFLAPPGDERAVAVLKASGLADADHHVRESAATELARRGDGAGERILVDMLARKRMPGVDPGDAALGERLLVREQVEICTLLAKLKSARGKAALESARKSPFEKVRAAAEKALEGW